MKTIRRLSAVLLGIVFFVSGILKLMDPVGTSLIVGEYFNFFHLAFMRPLSYFTGVMIGLVETSTGVALITGVMRRLVGFICLILLASFTLVTLVLLIANPEMDCGCFGEAVHLTHLQSFIKNIVLLLLWVLAFVPFGTVGESRKIKWVSFSIAEISILLFFLYSSLSIPLMDFTEFRSGAEISTYEDYDFTSDEKPLVLSFSDFNGEYADSLLLKGSVLAASVNNPAKLSDAKWKKLSAELTLAESRGYTALVLAASSPSLISAEVSDPDILSRMYFADRKQLLSLNRSNGGIVYVHDGQIIAKWSSNRMPDAEKLSSMMESDIAEVFSNEGGRSSFKFQAFMLYVFAVMLLL